MRAALRPHASNTDPDLPVFSAVRLAGFVDGWMSTHELLWLAEHAARRRAVVEFGSYCGRSAKALAVATPGTLWCIDPWTQEVGGPGSSWAAFQKNHAQDIASGHVVPMRMPSVKGAESLLARGVRADMVFIDGDHTHEGAAADIRVAVELLGGRGSGGLLCGHDMIEFWPGVVRAVGELIPNYRLPTYGAGCIWATVL